LKERILMVCHGNVCRSVGAQYILQNMLDKKGLSDCITVDSAATSREEIGNPIYPPMKAALEKRKIPIGTHRARQLKKADYEKYDLIIGMDEENAYYMRLILGADPEHKIHNLMEYTDHPDSVIDDPWYTRQFDHCAEQLEEGCRGVLAFITKK